MNTYINHSSKGVMMKSRLTVIAGLLSGAVLMLATAPAMARADVSVNIGVPGFYVQSEPDYAPAPRVYMQPRPVYMQPQPYYIDQQYRPDRHQRDWNGRHRGWRDRDRDGIPNRIDRDRDGDGVPNRFDSRPNNPYRD
ncbi:MAG: thrombospondin type 3 repeat-containing protein [Oxalobacteraceae bacterium]